MSQPSPSSTTTAPARGRMVQIATLIRSHAFILALLATQFVIVQLATGPQYGDAPRNLHWGLLTAEQPAFLLGAPDTFERIKGFTPDPPSLAPMGLTGGEYGGLHPWWGPVAPLLFAAIWKVSGSYTLLQLVVPLAGGAAVLLTYQLTRTFANARTALIAAAFLACFPLFREYATVSYTEAISACALTAALLAFARGRTVATIVLGAIAALCKMDILLFYFGVVGSVMVVGFLRRSWRTEVGLTLRHCVLALAGPALIVAPWVWYHHLKQGAGGPTRGLSAELFGIIAPQMLELLFYVPWYGALITIAAIGAAVVAGVTHRALPPLPTIMLTTWLALGALQLLLYAATPGAGNSPRVVLPALPPLAILFATGFVHLGAAWRRRIGFYLGVLFLLINIVSIGYHALLGAELRSYGPVWSVLRAQPRGFVMTEQYWASILYTRQPTAWFEADPTFERNIMHNRENFARYVGQNPIRYVVLPRRGDLASDTVREWLDTNAQSVDAGNFRIYTLP